MHYDGRERRDGVTRMCYEVMGFFLSWDLLLRYAIQMYVFKPPVLDSGYLNVSQETGAL